jgi:hypothetical protein
MKKVLLLINFVFFISNLNLFAQNYEWAYRWVDGTTQGAAGTGVDVDASGNSYIISYGGLTTNFNMSTNNVNSVYGPSFGCAAVTKLDAGGNFVWVKFVSTSGSITGGGCIPTSIKVKNGHLYVIGTFGGGGGQYDFDPNAGTAITGGSNPTLKGFLLKWDLDGNYVWHKVQTTTIGLSMNSLDIDNSNNPIICGSFYGSLYSGTLTMTSSGGNDAFVIKYDAAGNLIFGNNWGSTAWNNPTNESKGVTSDQNGNIYVTGNFYLTIDVDPSNGISNLTSNGNADVFVIKYSQTGSLIWAKSFGGTDNDQGNDINLTGTGNVCVVGMASGNVDFNPSIAINTISSTGAYGYLLEWDPNSNFSFVKGILPGNSQSMGVLTNVSVKNNEYILLGKCYGIVDIDPSNATNLVGTGNFTNNTLIIRLNALGNLLWGGALLNTDNYSNLPNEFAVSNNAIHIAGTFYGTVDFNPSTLYANTLTSFASTSGQPTMTNYILKLNTCSSVNTSNTISTCGDYTWNGQTYSNSGTYVQNFQTVAGCDSTVTLNLTINSSTSSSFSETSCEPYTWNGNTYASSGQYSQTLSGSNGCDSIVTLNLTILNGPTAQVTQDGLLLTANTVSGASYQWIYCSDLTPVPNQTFSQFAPQANGTYAVVITDNCGSDTSDCITISTIGIDELKSVFQVYPNPVNSELNVEIDLTVSEAIYSILDLNYRIIQTGKILQSQPINVRSLADGTYILKIESLGYVRFIKQ